MSGPPFALLTGASSPLGRACLERLSAAGLAVVSIGADRERGEALAEEAGGAFFTADGAHRPSMDAALERALALTAGQLRALVTLPEVDLCGSIEATSEAAFCRVLESGLTSAFRTARACWPSMRAAGGGSIVNVGSDAGLRAAHEQAAVSVSSAGVIAVAELLAAEGAPFAIRANAVCPAPLSAPGSGAADPHTAEEVASVVAWLASPASAGVSGATVRVDAGAGAAMVVHTRSEEPGAAGGERLDSRADGG